MALTAYQTGVASDPGDLIDKLATFAAANGWTVNTPTSGRVFINGTVLVGIGTDADEVFLRGAISYDAGLAYNAQPNNAGRTMAVFLGAGPYAAYYFFLGAESGSPYLHVVVEIEANRFTHFVVGSLVKQGAYTGGTYVSGTRWSTSTDRIDVYNSSYHERICDCGQDNSSMASHIWVDYDGKTNNWPRVTASGDTGTNDATGSFQAGGIIDNFVDDLRWQRYNFRTPLWPANYFVRRPSSLRSMVGRIPDFRILSIRNFAPKDIITIGGVDWMLFPLQVKRDASNTGDDLYNSFYDGYAYRRN